jgi:hypothetical protein
VARHRSAKPEAAHPDTDVHQAVACVRIRHASIRQHTSAYVSLRQHMSAHASIRQHPIRQHTSGSGPAHPTRTYATSLPDS